MKPFFGGVLAAALLGVFGVGATVGVREYRYYQQLKAEHQETKKYLEEVAVTFPDGKTLTRKQFLDVLVVASFSKKD